MNPPNHNESSQSKLTPEGVYIGKLVRYETRMSSSGKPYVEVEFSLHGLNEAPGVYTQVKAGSLFWRGFFSTEKGKALSIRTLKFLGMKGEDASVLTQSGALKLGQEAELVVKHELFGGKTSAKIAFVQPVGENDRWLAARKARTEQPNESANAFKDALNKW